jgi:hypothetical protein
MPRTTTPPTPSGVGSVAIEAQYGRIEVTTER